MGTNALFLARYERHAPTSKVLRPTFRAYAPRWYAQIGPTQRNEPQHETTAQQEPKDGWTPNGTRTHDGPHDAPRHDAHWCPTQRRSTPQLQVHRGRNAAAPAPGMPQGMPAAMPVPQAVPQQAPPQAAVFVQGQEPLTASMLAQAPPSEQKQMLGERLF